PRPTRTPTQPPRPSPPRCPRPSRRSAVTSAGSGGSRTETIATSSDGRRSITAGHLLPTKALTSWLATSMRSSARFVEAGRDRRDVRGDRTDELTQDENRAARVVPATPATGGSGDRGRLPVRQVGGGER